MSKASKPMQEMTDEGKLLDAARRCKLPVIEQIARSGKVDLNVADESGMAPIHYAVSNNYFGVMTLLVAYGGNPNLRNTKNRKTALHYACEAKNSHAVKFLIFCGADQSLKDITGRCPNLSELHVEETMEIKQAFKDGLIKSFGKMIHKAEEHPFPGNGFAINNTDKDSTEFMFFFRTMSVEHLRMVAASGLQLLKHLEAPDLEAASDAYEYIVYRRVVDIMVTIPIFSSPNEFDTVVVLIPRTTNTNVSKSNEQKRSLSVKGAFIVARVTFEVDNENVMSMVAVTKLKTDVHVVTGRAQTMISSVDEKFVVYLPEKSLPKDSNVALKILPVQDLPNMLNTEQVQKISNFYNIKPDHRVRKCIQIQLPSPANYDEKTAQSELVVFKTREIDDDDDWARVDAEITNEGRAVYITELSVNTGTYIIAEVTKKQKKSASDWLKGFLKQLYSLVFTRTKSCCFIAMTKHVRDTSFRLMVLLSEESRSNATERKWSKEDYITQASQKTESYLCKPGQPFTVEVDNTDSITVKGRSYFNLVFRSGKDNRHEFVVTGKDYDIAIVCISKRKKDGPLTDEERTERNVMNQINVELLSRNVMSQINVELLKNIPDGTPSVMHRFKGNGMGVLLHSLKVAGRMDLVKQIDSQVEQLVETSPEEGICLQVKRWRSILPTNREYFLDCLNHFVTVPSPFEERFLLKIATTIHYDVYVLQQLNVPQNHIDALRTDASNPTAAMLKCLLIAKRSYKDECVFYEDLMNALKHVRNNLAISEIKRECLNGLRHCEEPDRVRRLRNILNQY